MTLTHRLRPALVAAVAVLMLASLSGCGSSSVTAKRLGDAVAPTFAHLYVLQQSLRGRTVTASSLKPRATCTKGGAATPDRGAGPDWVCAIVWFKSGPDIAVTASYTVHVQTNGCYTAEGEGPPDLNGQQMLTTADGVSEINPLWAFDGCFDMT